MLKAATLTLQCRFVAFSRGERTAGTLPLLLLLTVIPCPGETSGFAIDEQDARAVAAVLAGRAALADDARTAFYNPAGLVRLQKENIIASGVAIIPSSTFSNKGSELRGSGLRGPEHGNADNTYVFPAVYIAKPISENMALGLSINTPFGSGSNYNNDWIGRYHTQDSELVVVNLNPSAAYRISDYVSIGAGISTQYLQASSSNAIDFGYFFGTSQELDGNLEIEADSFGFGFNIGILIEYQDVLQLGLSYRSQVNHDLDGSAEYTVPPAALPLATGDLFANTSISSNITLPSSLSASLLFKPSANFSLLGDITLTQWSSYDQLKIDFSNITQPDLFEIQDWKDSFRVSVGLEYKIDNSWSLLAGVAFDESPIPNRYQRPRLVVGDRTLIGFGLSYCCRQSFYFNLSYCHAFSEDIDIRLESDVAGTLVGRYKLGANLVGFEVGFLF